MLLKSKRANRSGKWRRQGTGEHRAAPRMERAPHERRHGGPVEDRAVYACECGYAFEAVVTTSVGCPHCARTQAW